MVTQLIFYVYTAADEVEKINYVSAAIDIFFKLSNVVYQCRFEPNTLQQR